MLEGRCRTLYWHAGATAQFTRDDKKGWILEQIKGRKNREAPPALKKAAQTAALQFNRAGNGDAASA